MGAARFLRGLKALLPPTDLTVIVNTGDDEGFYGLHVSPDIDTVLYTLAETEGTHGWGRRGDSFACLRQLDALYGDAWFQLGDQDLATHIFRTDHLNRGRTLTQVTRALASKLGVRQRIVPMTDARVRTEVTVARRGTLPFQEYLVHGRGRGRVLRIDVRGAARAKPAAGVLRAIQRATHIILPPSNPFVSIGPILQLPGVRSALRARRDRVVAVSPIIGARPVKGPLHKMLAGLGYPVSAVGVAQQYRDIARVFVLDERDRKLASRITALGMAPVVTDTLMTDRRRAEALARAVVDALASTRS